VVCLKSKRRVVRIASWSEAVPEGHGVIQGYFVPCTLLELTRCRCRPRWCEQGPRTSHVRLVSAPEDAVVGVRMQRRHWAETSASSQ